MQLVHSQTTTADFNADLIQAQREALNALREVMAETADPAEDDTTRLDDDDLKTRAARFRRLSLRLRAATAILRVKPLTEAPPDAPTDAPPGTHANTAAHTPSSRATDLPRGTTATPQPTTTNPQAPRATPQHPRLADSTPHRTSTVAPATHHPSTGARA